MRVKQYISSLLCTSAIFVSTQAYGLDKVNNIIIDGNQRIESSTIENYLTIKKGDDATSILQEKSIHSLYNTSLFEDVKISYNSGTLKVSVKETPLVVKVVLKGNSKIGTKNINKVILTQSGHSLKNKDIEHDTAKILEMYKKSGRFAVKVVAKVEKLKNNRAKVVFHISEGPKTAVKQIRFIGNKHYSSGHLRSVILTKETAWYKFLSSDDTYDPDRMEYDQVLLTQFYQSVGYADFKILSTNAELASTKSHFILTYAFDEGPKYKFGNVELQNNIAELKTSHVRGLARISKGRLFNIKTIESIEDKIAEKLGNMGYPQANVYHVLEKDPSSKVANVKFIIDTSDKVFVRKINIRGNLKTHDKVIRREFRIQEGDIFNRSYIEKADRNLRNLNYFEKVAIKPIPTKDPSRYDLDVDVQEKSTTSIGLEGGYNTSSGPFGRVSFDDRNLLGTGKQLHGAVQVAKRSTSYSAGITNPYFMDKDLSLGITGFYTHVGSGHASQFFGESNSYTLNTKGARTSLGYDLADDLSHSVFYTIKRDELLVSQEQQSLFIKEQVGKYTTSAVGQSITYNRLDNSYAPKSGYLLSGTQEFAGVGGDNKYLKHEVSISKYNSFAENKVTLKLSAETGQIHGTKKHKVRINDRFNLGDQSLRGFAPRGIGPRDKRTGEALGGKKYYAATAELQFPIGAPEEFNLNGALFTDIGGVYDIDIKKGAEYTKKDIYNSNVPRITYGMGLIWNTRIAPIKIYYAFRLRKQKYDEIQPWTLSLTTAF
ncbi:MAG UNVERIFIED_CONTAM: outer membrane protein assembly factor BamA [Rickettsiaceae bacterium]|jgi:outer membrane protein insertion porin family